MERLKTCLVIALLVCLGTGALSAYTLLSPRRSWPSLPVNIIVDDRGLPSISDGDFGRTRTRNALVSRLAWNGAGLGTVLTAVVGSVASFTLGDGIVMLNFRDPVGACSGSCLTATFTGFYSGGTITDADIVTNASGFAWASAGEPCSNEIYVEGVMVREAGRVLGLGTSSVPGATMYPSIGYCNNGPASIETDDKNALNDLY
jgi:Matrixin